MIFLAFNKKKIKKKNHLFPILYDNSSDYFSQNLKNTVHTKIPYTPTLYRTVQYT